CTVEYTLLGVSVVFFFQAEDGIRDWSVTGVQTCALPISFNAAGVCNGNNRSQQRLAGDAGPIIAFAAEQLFLHYHDAESVRTGRSEERRVGKEWRARWVPYP